MHAEIIAHFSLALPLRVRSLGDFCAKASLELPRLEAYHLCSLMVLAMRSPRTLSARPSDQSTVRPTDRPTMHADQDEELARVSDLERVDPPSGSTTIPLQQRSCWAFSPADEVKASNFEFGFHFRYLSALQDSAHLGLFMTFIHRLLCDSVLLVHFSRFSML